MKKALELNLDEEVVKGVVRGVGEVTKSVFVPGYMFGCLVKKFVRSEADWSGRDCGNQTIGRVLNIGALTITGGITYLQVMGYLNLAQSVFR